MSNLPQARFGHYLEDIIQEKNIKMKDLAKFLGVSKHMLKSLKKECGERWEPMYSVREDEG